MTLAPSPVSPDCVLEKNTIDVWTADLDRPSDEMRALEGLLSTDERERASRFYFMSDRQRFVAGRGILRFVLAGYAGLGPAQLRFSQGQFGKPALVDGCAAHLRFNLSHAGSKAIYAVTLDREIGADLEHVDPSFVEPGIEENFFSPTEIAALRSLPKNLRVRAFFNCWTRKEAYVKALGGGLQIPLRSFDVSLAPGQEAAFLSERESSWSLLDLPLGREYVGAVAVEQKGWRVRLRQWQMGAERGSRALGEYLR